MKKYIVFSLIMSLLLLSACNSNTTENIESSTTNLLAEEQASSEETPQPNLIENNITQSGSYEFTGDLSNITVNVNKDIDDGVVSIVLNNANIENNNGTPINIIEAKDVHIILQGENFVTQGAIDTADTEFPSAAIYSKADTIISGDGSLVVSSEYQDGINSRDDLIIDSGNITVTAVDDGIVGKDLLEINEAIININCGKDGLKASNDEDLDKGNLIISNGTFNINAQNDGISAENDLQINNGSFEINTGGGFSEVLNEITRGEGSGNIVSATDMLEDSMKGLKANDIIISDGSFIISSYEDAIHANNNLTINDGNFSILSGDDAFHADMALIINDGEIIVTDAYEGLEGSTVDINGGNIDIKVLDDAINASEDNGYVKITNGTILLKSQGDGIDSNGDLFIEGGEVVIDVDAIYSGGDSELDVTGEFNISGGNVTDENGNPVSLSDRGGGGGPQPNNRPRP